MVMLCEGGGVGDGAVRVVNGGRQCVHGGGGDPVL